MEPFDGFHRATMPDVLSQGEDGIAVPATRAGCGRAGAA
jgi:hypothetical protein